VLGDILVDITDDITEKVVYKCGRTTEFTWGKWFINDETSYKFVDVKKDNIAILKNQYTIIGSTSVFNLGDSGAAVYVKINGKFHLIGIAMGCNSDGEEYYVSPIAAVLEALGQGVRVEQFTDP